MTQSDESWLKRVDSGAKLWKMNDWSEGEAQQRIHQIRCEKADKSSRIVTAGTAVDS